MKSVLQILVSAVVAKTFVSASISNSTRYPYFASLLGNACEVSYEYDPEDGGGIVIDPPLLPKIHQEQDCGELVQYCSGALVAPNIVLTTASCFFTVGDAEFPSHVQFGADGAIEVEERIVHPGYNGETMNFDYMILFLKENAVGVEPLILNFNLATIGDVVTMLKVDHEEDQVVVEEIAMKILHNENCTDDFGESFVAQNMMCAIKANARRSRSSFCNDGSTTGAPLLLPSDNNTKDSMIGMVSWRQCNERSNDDQPIVFSRISSPSFIVFARLFAPELVNFDNTDDPNQYTPAIIATAIGTVAVFIFAMSFIAFYAFGTNSSSDNADAADKEMVNVNEVEAVEAKVLQVHSGANSI